MYIQTENGIVPCEKVETKIVLNYYGEGLHERLDVVLALGDQPENVTETIVYQKLNQDESIILP